MTEFGKRTDGVDEPEFVRLEPWEEICGQLESVREDKLHVIVELSTGTLAYRKGSKAGQLCKDMLACEESAAVAILRVPDRSPPIQILVNHPE